MSITVTVARTNSVSLAKAVKERAQEHLTTCADAEALWETMVAILVEDLGGVQGKRGERLFSEVSYRYVQLCWGNPETEGRDRRISPYIHLGKRPHLAASRHDFGSYYQDFHLDNGEEVEAFMVLIMEYVALKHAEFLAT